MYPITNLKELITFLGALMGVWAAANADGKITLADAGLLLTIIPSAGPAISDIGQVPKEILDLSDAEKAELNAHIDSVFGEGKAAQIGAEVMRLAISLARIYAIAKAPAA